MRHEHVHHHTELRYWLALHVAPTHTTVRKTAAVITPEHVFDNANGRSKVGRRRIESLANVGSKATANHTKLS